MIEVVKIIYLLIKIVDDLLDLFHLLLAHVVKLGVQA